MKYIKLFETSAAFENFTLDESNTPNVSLIEELLNTPGGGLAYTQKILPHDYSLDYFTLVAIDDCEFGFRTDCYDEGDGLSYSLDNGATWSEYYNNSFDTNTYEDHYISVTAGNKVLFKGHNFNVSSNGSCSLAPIFFTESIVRYNSENPSKFNVEGNVMSLLYGDNFIGQTSFNSESNYILSCLFHNIGGLINAENLILPATTLTDACYQYMFGGCKDLITAPSLPATTLTDYCYNSMFHDCTSLTTAPELPATTLANECYCNMFQYCTSLSSIKCLATDISANYCTSGWVYDIAQTGTFTKASDMTDWTEGDDGIPSGWTVQNAE